MIKRNGTGIQTKKSKLFNKVLGVHCRQARLKYDMSQEDVSIKVGCTPSAISQFESGKLNNATVLAYYCYFFKVDLRLVFFEFNKLNRLNKNGGNEIED